MAKITEFFSNPGVGAFLFCLFLVLLGWPFISIADRPGYAVFVYLFLIWSLIIVLLFVIQKSCREDCGAKGINDQDITDV